MLHSVIVISLTCSYSHFLSDVCVRCSCSSVFLAALCISVQLFGPFNVQFTGFTQGGDRFLPERTLFLHLVLFFFMVFPVLIDKYVISKINELCRLEMLCFCGFCTFLKGRGWGSLHRRKQQSLFPRLFISVYCRCCNKEIKR